MRNVASTGLVFGNLRTFEICYAILRTSRVWLYDHPILRYFELHFSRVLQGTFKSYHMIFAYEFPHRVSIYTITKSVDTLGFIF